MALPKFENIISKPMIQQTNYEFSSIVVEFNSTELSLVVYIDT